MIVIKVNNLSKNFKLYSSSGKSMLSILAGVLELDEGSFEVNGILQV
jgi:hypothetical protein